MHGGGGIDPRQYVGPYRMDKTLGKGQTGKHQGITSRIFWKKSVPKLFPF